MVIKYFDRIMRIRTNAVSGVVLPSRSAPVDQ
jgi:hypothetical protein